MVHPCLVKGCRNKAKDGIFRFPRDDHLREKWIINLELDGSLLQDSSRICGQHFHESDFQRDLKGELLGIPSKKKMLVPDAIPSLGVMKDCQFKKHRMEKLYLQRRYLNMNETKKFKLEKEEILRKLKQEAAMNVLKEKISQCPSEEANVVKTLPPTKCVILQPLGADEDVGNKVPVIIPGDPEHSISMLQDEKIKEFIESQVAETQETANASDASAIVVNTMPLSAEHYLASSSTPEIQPGKSLLKKRSGFVPIRIKMDPEVMEQTLDPKEVLQDDHQESRKCKVMDLLFDQTDSSTLTSEQIPEPQPVPGDANLDVIVQRGKGAEWADKHLVFFDPDGLKQELDIYKAETKQLRKDNYDIKMRNQVLRNERKKLQKKLEIRDKLIESKKTKAKKDVEIITKLRQELANLRQLKNKMRRREYNRKAKHQKVLERRKVRRAYIMNQIELGHMDKSALSLIYSRKKLPCDNTTAKAVISVPAHHQFQPMEVTQHIIPASTATVEYVIEHDETATAVAGISGDNNQLATYHVETVQADESGAMIATSINEYGAEQINFIMKAVQEDIKK